MYLVVISVARSDKRMVLGYKQIGIHKNASKTKKKENITMTGD